MPLHVDDLDGLDDYDRLLVSDMDNSRPEYAVSDDDTPVNVASDGSEGALGSGSLESSVAGEDSVTGEVMLGYECGVRAANTPPAV
jgi:hypothetical protein